MRSEIIFRAKEIIINKYMLCQSVAKAEPSYFFHERPGNDQQCA
jgi:hypothetical protein